MLPHVRQWFDARTFSSRQWSAAELLTRKAGQRIAVVLPAVAPST